MKQNKFFVAIWISLSLFSNITFGLNEPAAICVSTDDLQTHYKRTWPSQNFLQFLEDADYAPACIQYLRKKYPKDNELINFILLSHYVYGYRNAISNANSLKEKLEILAKKITFLIAEPDWIDNGCEPYLVSTDDGSDRGGAGLRYKAIKIVMDEVKVSEK
jgi:hypothetical protein